MVARCTGVNLVKRSVAKDLVIVDTWSYVDVVKVTKPA